MLLVKITRRISNNLSVKSCCVQAFSGVAERSQSITQHQEVQHCTARFSSPSFSLLHFLRTGRRRNDGGIFTSGNGRGSKENKPTDMTGRKQKRHCKILPLLSVVCPASSKTGQWLRYRKCGGTSGSLDTTTQSAMWCLCSWAEFRQRFSRVALIPASLCPVDCNLLFILSGSTATWRVKSRRKERNRRRTIVLAALPLELFITPS